MSKAKELAMKVMAQSYDDELRLLAMEVIKEDKTPTGPDFSENYAEEDKLRKLWDLQRKL